MYMRERSKVALLFCDSYDSDQVYRKIKKGMELLGGWEKLIEKDEKILLKPNLVRKAPVERPVITHPSIVEATARLLREEGYEKIGCGDSCGVGSAAKVMEETGMDAILDRYHITMEDFNQGTQTGEFVLADPVRESDALINLCKMKTHALERVTGGVKNLYGCVSGLHKAQGHTKYSNADSFARMLIRLNMEIKPRLCIMDGIVAMDGNGPTSGDPITMNVILMSTDPVAADSVFCHLVHLDPEMVPTNVHGQKMGLGFWEKEKICILTEEGEISMEEAVEKYGNKDYNVDRRKVRATMWNQLDFLMKPFQKKPYILTDKCRKCGVCVESCPVEEKALSFEKGRNNPPVYHYRKCIRCFCCQEMCPFQAIGVR